MAKASIDLVIAIRNTIQNLKNADNYQWGHMGCCNCGFLAQEITKFRKDEIHKRALQGHGDWSEQLNDYCPGSGMPMEDVISLMIEAGLDIDDLKHLERLSDPKILKSLPYPHKSLRHNHKGDVILYYQAWAIQLELELISEVQINERETVKLVIAE
jgi:hypothetical protein